MSAVPELRAPSFFRVIAACMYDGMLTIAILFVAASLALVWTGGIAVSAGNPVYQLYLLACAFPYYALCWIRGGQTLGMRTWRVRIVALDGGAIGLGQALLRFLAAMLSLFSAGLGFLWILIDRERRSWHDVISRSRLVVLPSARDAQRPSSGSA